MLDLLLLGLIPGTQIQISFGAWLVCLAIIIEMAGLYYIQSRLRPVLVASVYISSWRAIRTTSRLA